MGLVNRQQLLDRLHLYEDRIANDQIDSVVAQCLAAIRNRNEHLLGIRQPTTTKLDDGRALKSRPDEFGAEDPDGCRFGSDIALNCDDSEVARAGIEPATFRFSGGRSYQLSYLAGGHDRATPNWRP